MSFYHENFCYTLFQVQYEEDVKKLFFSTVVDLIETSCNCHYSSQLIQDQTLLCINSRSNTNSHATYRAKLNSIEGHTSRELVSSMEMWRVMGQVVLLRDQVRNTQSELSILKAKDCPAAISFKSAPLCIPQVRLRPNMNVTTDQMKDCAISIPVFIASIVAEFLLLLLLFLVGIAIPLLKARKKRYALTMQKIGGGGGNFSSVLPDYTPAW